MENKEIDWEFILNSIKQEKSILFLGPEIAQNTAGKTLQSEFFEKLYSENSSKIITFHEGDNFLLFESPAVRTRLAYKIEEFYSQTFAEELLSKLVQIPFHLVISLTPDVSYKKICEKQGIECKTDYYKKGLKKDLETKPNAYVPYMYNLFGSVEEIDTLILSHFDLYEYLKAIYSEKNLPLKIQTALDNANNFIFIGVHFGHWYYQLLMSLLNLNSEKFVNFSPTYQLDRKTFILCEKHFNIEFDGRNTSDFVDVLHEKCKLKNMLRLKEDRLLTVYDKIIRFIENDEIENAMEMLKENLTDEDLQDELVLLKGQLAFTTKRLAKGLVSPQDASVDMARIKSALIGMSNELKNG